MYSLADMPQATITSGTPYDTLVRCASERAVKLSPQFRREIVLTSAECDDVYQTLQFGRVEARMIRKLDLAIRAIERILDGFAAELGDRFVASAIVPKFIARGLESIRAQINDEANESRREFAVESADDELYLGARIRRIYVPKNEILGPAINNTLAFWDYKQNIQGTPQQCENLPIRPQCRYTPGHRTKHSKN